MKLSHILLPAIVAIFAACSDHADPKELINKEASLPESFNFNQMGLKVINSSINQKKSTMSTLYGNDNALNTLKAGTGIQADEVIALVTWKQKEDKHWFGAKIPGSLQSLELIKTIKDKSGMPQITYTRYEGSKLMPIKDTTGNAQSIKYIFDQNPSVMP